MQDDLRYMVIRDLGGTGGNGGYEGQMAIDKQTGYMLDLETPNGNPCFLKPWSPPSACVPQSDPSVLMTRTFNYDPNSPTSPSASYYSVPPTSIAYYQEQSVETVPASYVSNFEPYNMVSGTLVPWISQSGFLSIINSPLTKALLTFPAHPAPADYLHSYQPPDPRYPLQNRPLSLTFPMVLTAGAPLGMAPYQSQYWGTGAEVYQQVFGPSTATLNSWTGLDPVLSTLPAPNDDPASTATVTSSLKAFIDSCNTWARTTPSLVPPVLPLSAPLFAEPASPYGPSESIWCQFWYMPPSGTALGRSAMEIRGGSSMYAATAPYCSDLTVMRGERNSPYPLMGPLTPHRSATRPPIPLKGSTNGSCRERLFISPFCMEMRFQARLSPSSGWSLSIGIRA